MEYTITKKKIKNFILRIYPDLTIAVSAPLSATSKDIENFVLSKKCNYALFLSKISFYIIFFVSLHTEKINKSFIDLLKWDNYKTDIRRIESLKNS